MVVKIEEAEENFNEIIDDANQNLEISLNRTMRNDGRITSYNVCYTKLLRNDMQLASIRENEGNSRVSQMNDAFVLQKDYAKVLSFYDDMRKLTKRNNFV